MSAITFLRRQARRLLLGRRLTSAIGRMRSWRLTPGAVRGKPGEELLAEVHSQYSHIRVTQRGPVRTLYFVVDGIQYVESRVNFDRPKSLCLDYTRTMLAGFVVSPEARSILMVGLGGGQISNYLFERIAAIEIDSVDIDSQVVLLAQEYFQLPADPRYRVHVDDGRLFLERRRRRAAWDMIVLDAFRGHFVPRHVASLEFYQACRDCLTPGGVVVANLHVRSDRYPSGCNTLQSVFPVHYMFRGELNDQTAFVGISGDQRLSARELSANARSLAPHFDFDLPGLASRHYCERELPTGTPIIRDDFEYDELAEAIRRQELQW